MLLIIVRSYAWNWLDIHKTTNDLLQQAVRVPALAADQIEKSVTWSAQRETTHGHAAPAGADDGDYPPGRRRGWRPDHAVGLSKFIDMIELAWIGENHTKERKEIEIIYKTKNW